MSRYVRKDLLLPHRNLKIHKYILTNTWLLCSKHLLTCAKLQLLYFQLFDNIMLEKPCKSRKRRDVTAKSKRHSCGTAEPLQNDNIPHEQECMWFNKNTSYKQDLWFKLKDDFNFVWSWTSLSNAVDRALIANCFCKVKIAWSGGTFAFQRSMFRCQSVPAWMKKGILWKLLRSAGWAEMTPRRAVISYSIMPRLCVCIDGEEATQTPAYSLSTSFQLFVLKCCALIKMPF